MPLQLTVVSPHLDDAVLSCGQLLAANHGAVVATVFAGRPPASTALPEWDTRCGFRVGDDVIGVRREEDRAALASLDATPIWLDFCDEQYQQPRDLLHIAKTLRAALQARRQGALLLPLGIHHLDHQCTHIVCLALVPAFKEAYVYEDAVYRSFDQAGVRFRLQELQQKGWRLEAAHLSQEAWLERKTQALHCYASQFRALCDSEGPGIEDAFRPERYWRLTRD